MVMKFVELIRCWHEVKRENIEDKKKIIHSMYELGCQIAQDYFYILKEHELKTMEVKYHPDDIIQSIELHREKLHVRRQEARAALQLTYWETNPMYKKLIYGICLILCGDNAEKYMDIPKDAIGRCGHTLMDIISRYEAIKIYYDGDRNQIMNEMRRIIKRQYAAVEEGVKNMTEAYQAIMENLILI